MYCLDTNVVIAGMTRRAPHLASRLDSELARGTQLIIPIAVLFELRYGVAKSDRPGKSSALLTQFLGARFEIAEFNIDDATHAAEIRATLERAGTPIGHYDYLIAAQARRLGATLVTLNSREFSRVPGLQVTDWAA